MNSDEEEVDTILSEESEEEMIDYINISDQDSVESFYETDGDEEDEYFNISENDKGFICIDFKDSCTKRCSLQESSINKNYIWLGLGTERMHLSRNQTEKLLPYLYDFVNNGTLIKTKATHISTNEVPQKPLDLLY